MTTLDKSIFFFFMGILLSIGFVANKQAKVAKDSLLETLLMGRELGLPLFVGTLVASWYGGILGVTRISFEQGITSFLTQGVFWYGTYIFFAFFLVDKIDKYRAVTLPHLIGEMFGPQSGKIAGYFNLFTVLPLVYALSMGFIFQTLFEGPLFLWTGIGLFIVTLYALFGGFRAIVFSDFLQFILMCLGVVLVVFFSWKEYGGYEYLQRSLPKEHFNFTSSEGIGATLAWGFIALSTLVDPNFYQRCFAARSKKVAKRGILISTFIWICFDICTTLGGMYAKARFPDADGNTAYLTYALDLLPNGFRGLFLAGLVSTILSTLDSYLFLATTTLSFDILKEKLEHKKAFIFVALFTWVLSYWSGGNIALIWKTLGGYSASCFLLPVLIGHFNPGKIHDKDFVWACSMGILGTTLWKFIEKEGSLEYIDEMYIGALSTALTIGIRLWKRK